MFDNLTLNQAVARANEMLSDGAFHYIVTPNPEFLIAARKDSDFRALLNHAGLTLADGIGVIYAAKILKTPLVGRVTGIDFSQALLQSQSEKERKTRLFLLGAKPGVADAAGEYLETTYPGITICGTQDGYFTDDNAVVAQIRDANADILFVCLGSPKQEKWMSAFGRETGCTLAVGLGGCLDVFAGTVSRAPKFFQTLGLEWFYRLVKQPSRAKRMIKLPLVLFYAWSERFLGKKEDNT